MPNYSCKQYQLKQKGVELPEEDISIVRQNHKQEKVFQKHSFHTQIYVYPGLGKINILVRRYLTCVGI